MKRARKGVGSIVPAPCRSAERATMIHAYIEGFKRHYPHHEVKVKPVRDKRYPEPRYRVFINGEGGDITLSADDMRFATRMFNR